MSAQSARIWGTLDPFVEPGPVIGRKVANQGFLEALLRANPFDAYHFFLQDRNSAQVLEHFIRDHAPNIAARVGIYPRTELPRQLAANTYQAFHLSDCLTSQGFLAALRNRVARNIFPITGVTHSLSYARYGQAFAQHVWPGVTARDCIVATSRAGQAVVTRILEGLAPTHCPRPVVRVVPLGVWTADFKDRCPDSTLPDQAVVFLVPGRISPYSKMDLLPLLRAFQRLARSGTSLDNICLVLAGGVDESLSLPGTLTNLAANLGLDLRVIPCPNEAAKKALLARSDVVVSLADNPQETFGLTLLEAASAGKPVIASDYDGYRDLVRHQQTGLLTPTLDRGEDKLLPLMAPLLYDSTYHLWLAQDVAVDVGVLADHLRLLLDPVRRTDMGRAAGRHALDFDWSVVINKYLALWDELQTMPAPEPGQADSRHPLALDYGQVFAGYPSRRLGQGDELVVTELGQAVYRKRDFPVVYAGLEDRIDLDLMRRILVRTRRPITMDKLHQAEPVALFSATVMWMLKNDYLQHKRGEAATAFDIAASGQLGV